MKVFQKVMNRIKQSTGLYKLASYWTAADTVEFNDGQTLEQCKSSFENAINNKGDTLYYDSETHMLYLLSGEDRLSGVEILSSGQGEVLGNVTNISAEASEKDVLIKWTDPEDGENIEWQGTIVMRKPNSRPVDCMDGTLIVDSTTRNQYQTEGYLDENLSSNTNYYYRFFPYSTEGHIRTGSAILVKTEVDETYIEEYPTIKGTYTYTGQTQNVQFDNFNAEKMEVTSGGSGVNADTYTVVVSPKEGFKWPDGSTTGISLTWTINKAIISVVPSQSGTVTYTGSSRTPTWANYDANKFDVSGDTSGTNAGTYTVAFTPKSNYQWDDGTSVSKEVTWSIQKALINNTPVQSGTLSYDGTVKTPTWNYYNESQLAISGQTSGTDVGTYTAVFTPTSNYQWNDYTTVGKEIQWSIVETMIAIPTQNGTLTYDGTSKTPVWDNYDEDIMTKTETAQTNAGTYSTIFSLESGYAWSDGTTTDKTVNWTIARATITIPSVTSTLKYNGNSQSPTWNSYYDTNKMTLGGTTSGINAGTYSATFTPTSNYQWGDGSVNSKTVTWSINKADGTLTLSKQSITFSALNATDTVIASNFNGTLSASTSLSSVATVSVNQASGYITITCKGNGSANITVSVASSTNYTAVSKTISVSASIPQTISNVPTQKNTLTYNASSQTPTWNYYNTSQLTLSGTTSGTNAGNYTAKFTPKSGYAWSDGTNTTKNVTWTIGKANQSLALSTTTVSVDENNTTTVTASNYVGTLSANTSNSSIATATINGSTITINGISSGSATITITAGSTTNYYSTNKTISVTVSASYNTIRKLPIGARIIDTTTKDWANNPIHFIKADDDYNVSGASTLLYLFNRGYQYYDYKEQDNPIARYKDSGNNNYKWSNIRQWINAAGPYNYWYEDQHDYDAISNQFKSINGFICHFSQNIKENIIKTTHVTNQFIPTSYSNGYVNGEYSNETVEDRLYIPSAAEFLGLQGTTTSDANEYANLITEESSQVRRITGFNPDIMGSIYEQELGSPYYTNTYIITRTAYHLSDDLSKTRSVNANVISHVNRWNVTYNTSTHYVSYSNRTMCPAYNNEGVCIVPICFDINSSLRVSEQPNSNGYYEIIWEDSPSPQVYPLQDFSLNSEITPIGSFPYQITQTWDSYNLPSDITANNINWESTSSNLLRVVNKTVNNGTFTLTYEVLAAGRANYRYNYTGLGSNYSTEQRTGSVWINNP